MPNKQAFSQAKGAQPPDRVSFTLRLIGQCVCFLTRNLGNSLLSPFSESKESKKKKRRIHFTFIRVKAYKVLFFLYLFFFVRCLKLVFLFVTAVVLGLAKSPVATAVPIGGVKDNVNKVRVVA